MHKMIDVIGSFLVLTLLQAMQFGDKSISRKDLMRFRGNIPSHLVNHLMEEVFSERELTTCSLTGSKSRGNEIKPALDGEKLMAIISKYHVAQLL